MSVNLFLFYKSLFKRFYVIIFRFYMVLPNNFVFCLTSLNMIISRSIHVAANGIFSFFFMAE